MGLMLFHKKLYLDDENLKNKRKIIKKLKHNKLALGVYVLTLSEAKTEQIEIYPTYVLLQKAYKDKEIMVVGIADGMDNAQGLLIKMTEDCLRETGTVSLKEYFAI